MYWILDVLDYVPVVGAVKNGIEAGLHFYSGNNEEGKSKAIKAALSGVLDAASFGVGGAIVKLGGIGVTKLAGKVAVETAGTMAGKVLTKGVINAGVKAAGTLVKTSAVAVAITIKNNGQNNINEKNKGGKKTKTQTNNNSQKDKTENKNQKKGKKKPGKQKKNPDKDDQEKDGEGGKGNGGTSIKKRGDHIINNGILSLYRDIIEIFLTTQDLHYMTVYTKLPLEIVIYHDTPFSPIVTQNIGQRLVIHGGLNTVSYNHDIYGYHNSRVITATVRYMQLLTVRQANPHDGRVGEIQPQRDLAVKQVKRMIEEDAFVDAAALDEILPADRDSFNRAREETIRMLEALIGLAERWVHLICTAKNMPKLDGKVTYCAEVDENDVHRKVPSGNS